MMLLSLALTYPPTGLGVHLGILFGLPVRLAERHTERSSSLPYTADVSQCKFGLHTASYLVPIYARLEADLRKYSYLTSERKHALLEQCKDTEGTCTAISIRGGKVSVAQLGAGFETRHSDVLELVKRVANKFYPLPDVDFVIDTGDGNPDTDHLPRFMMCGHVQSRQGIMVPDFTFYDYPTTTCPGELSGHKFSSFLDIASKRLGEMEADPDGMINKRTNKLFWRGARLGNPRRIQQMEAILKSAAPRADMYDIAPMTWKANVGEGMNLADGCVSLHDHCNRRFLLHLRGNTYSSRLKYLLLCGSVVLMPEQEYEEWWSPAVPSKESATDDNRIIAHVKEDVSDIHDVLGSFITSSLRPNASKKTIDQSLRTIRFAIQVFSEQNVDCYWEAVIRGAAKAWGPILPDHRGRPIDDVLADPKESFSEL